MLRNAARSMAARKGIHDVDDLALRMMLETVTALRMFVNDEVNELQFAISAVAENMLRPGKQTIFCSSFGTPCTRDPPSAKKKGGRLRFGGPVL